MNTFFCVMARPKNRSTEMMVEAFNRREDAEFCCFVKTDEHPVWDFRVAEYREIKTITMEENDNDAG